MNSIFHIQVGMEFTEDEVREKLTEMGYINVPPNKLKEFMYGK